MVTSNKSKKPFFVKEGVRTGKERLSPQQIIRALVRAKNWKLTDLAKEIGYTKQSLNHYLHGYWAVPTQVKVKIAEVLEVDSSVIWDLEEKKNG